MKFIKRRLSEVEMSALHFKALGIDEKRKAFFTELKAIIPKM